MQSLDIIYPDDWHCHLRDDPYLSFTVPMAARHFKRAIVMPNLKAPVTNTLAAQSYLERIKKYIPAGSNFTPLMILYLKQETTPQIIYEAKESGIVFGVKLYPMGVTTNSSGGINDIESLYPTFSAMEKCTMPLLVHGEVHAADVDIFDREARFLEVLDKVIAAFPKLKIVLEHITTKEAAEFVLSAPNNVAATITPQHLLFNRNDMLSGGIKPHLYCLPILKRRSHQEALIKVATSGNQKFFIGTDSAPHAQSQKESACGCAGVFNHYNAIATYAQVFENANALDKLEGFLSLYGPRFYDLPINQERMKLQKQTQTTPTYFDYAQEKIIPFRAGEALAWSVE